MLALLGSSDSETSFLFNIQETRTLKGFLLKFSGTNSATAVLPADVGRVRCWFRNYPIYDINYDCSQAFSEVNGGFVDTTSTASGAFNFTTFFPVSWNDNNVLSLDQRDNMRWECTLNSNYATRVASGNLIELYGIVENGVQAYTLTMNQNSESLSASQYLVKNYPYENICGVYFSDIVSSVFTLTGSNLARVKATLGDRNADATLSAWLDYTRIVKEREATYSLIAELYGSEIGSFGAPNRLKNSVNVSWQNGSGGTSTAQLLLVGSLLNPNKLAESSAKVLAELQQDIRDKQQSNQSRAVQTLSATGQLPTGV